MRLSPQAKATGPGWKGIALAGALSLLMHGAILAMLVPPQVEGTIAGGGAAVPAALGSDFRDFARGAVPSVPDMAASAPSPTGATPAPSPPAESAIAVLTAEADTPRPQRRPDRTARSAQTAEADGDSDRSARRGSADGARGQAETQAVTRASAPGTAAVSTYPGEVMRQIQRVRQARVRARGSATVVFTIAADGRLAAAALARSSGSAELDQAALDHLHRAAPFPAPPPGAQRDFSFDFRGR